MLKFLLWFYSVTWMEKKSNQRTTDTFYSYSLVHVNLANVLRRTKKYNHEYCTPF